MLKVDLMKFPWDKPQISFLTQVFVKKVFITLSES